MPKPSDQRRGVKIPEAIGPLPVLPLFFRLQGREVLAAGGSEAMGWKLDLLQAAGARVVMTETVGACAVVVRRIADHRLPTIPLAEAMQDPGRFALIVADLTDAGRATALHGAALAAGVPINQIDRPALCTVQFGSIVNRSPVVIGISTDGTAPVLGQAIRTRIEGLLPRTLGAWAEAARRLRGDVAGRFALPARRRAFWRGFADRALSSRQAPAANDIDLSGMATGETGGRVTLVGAGPGDPDLLTLRAVRALQNADVILFDALVAPEIVEMARREAKRLPVGKRGGRPSCQQAEINALMLRFARDGKHVVRLKSGDPAIFSRGGEEARSLAAAGIPFDIVPGITTASAAAASLGVTLTDRTQGRQLLFVSGHGRDNGQAAIDWRAVADADTTVALYMGRRRIREFAERSLAAGASAGTPAAVGTSISRPGEQWLHTTIAGLATAASATDADAPCLVLVGRVLADALGRAEMMDQVRVAHG